MKVLYRILRNDLCDTKVFGATTQMLLLLTLGNWYINTDLFYRESIMVRVCSFSF